MAAYIILKLSAYSTWDSTCKIPMDCRIFHMTWLFFCLQAEVNACNTARLKPLLMHRTGCILLIYLNFYAYILFVVVFNLVSAHLADSCLVTICLFVCSRQLVVAGYYYCYCLSDNQWWQCIKVEGAGGLPLLVQIGDSFRHNTYMYILYLRFEDAIAVNLCTDLPITNTIDGQWLNSWIFYDDIKFITANG